MNFFIQRPIFDMSIALVMILAGAAGGDIYDRHEKSKEKAYEEGYKEGQKKKQ